MSKDQSTRRGTPARFATGLLWAGLLLSLPSAPVFAAPAAGAAAATAEARYRADRAACLEGRSGQALATCLKEAGAARAMARAEARQPRRAEAQPDYAANALARCERQPEAERADCRLRMQGHGSQKGSVAGGGIMYEMVTKSVGAPASAASAP